MRRRDEGFGEDVPFDPLRVRAGYEQCCKNGNCHPEFVAHGRVLLWSRRPTHCGGNAAMFSALVLFLDLTAAVDDDAYFLAVLDRPGDHPFGGRLYVADHRVASSLKLRDELLLC